MMDEKQGLVLDCVEHYAAEIMMGGPVSTQELESIGRTNQLRINRVDE